MGWSIDFKRDKPLNATLTLCVRVAYAKRMNSIQFVSVTYISVHNNIDAIKCATN